MWSVHNLMKLNPNLSKVSTPSCTLLSSEYRTNLTKLDWNEEHTTAIQRKKDSIKQTMERDF